MILILKSGKPKGKKGLTNRRTKAAICTILGICEVIRKAFYLTHQTCKIEVDLNCVRLGLHQSPAENIFDVDPECPGMSYPVGGHRLLTQNWNVSCGFPWFLIFGVGILAFLSETTMGDGALRHLDQTSRWLESSLLGVIFIILLTSEVACIGVAHFSGLPTFQTTSLAFAQINPIAQISQSRIIFTFELEVTRRIC